ncbi:unnamed protein product [Sphagnum troendelagicum]
MTEEDGGVGINGVLPTREYEGKTTIHVILACLVAATGGLIFGYDIGISGGVTSMNDFLIKFFPVVYKRKLSAQESDYCKYDNQGLQAFTSSLYIAGLLATLVASYTTRKWGRKATMFIGGTSYLVGSILNAAAQDLAMLIIGRIMLGIGVGFGNQAVPLYLSELAPARWRGALNMLFQLATTTGNLTANLINYGTGKINPWGWRLSLGLAGVPACLLILGSILAPETPNSLIERGHFEKGRATLEKVRGTPNVDLEYDDILEASRAANQVKHPFRNILQRKNRPQLAMAIFCPFFQEFTGINNILFYAPVLFQTIGFGADASLYSAVITGACLWGFTFVTILTVDRWGRRKLLLTGGLLMFISQVLIGIILALKFVGNQPLPKNYATAVVVLICLYVAAFSWSWGGLGWLIPSEVFSLQTRSAGQSITVCVNLMFVFVIAQAFLTMLCHMRFGIFLFFSGWVFIMTVSVYFFLPETKGVPIEEMSLLWRSHWFWRRFVPPPEDEKPPPPT